MEPEVLHFRISAAFQRAGDRVLRNSLPILSSKSESMNVSHLRLFPLGFDLVQDLGDTICKRCHLPNAGLDPAAFGFDDPLLAIDHVIGQAN